MASTQSRESLKENLSILWLFCQRTEKGLPACWLRRTDFDSAGNIWTNNLRRLFHGYFFRQLK